MIPACSECSYWRHIVDQYGACRRHAPQKAQDTVHAVWPVTPSSDFCGEWLKRQPQPQEPNASKERLN